MKVLLILLAAVMAVSALPTPATDLDKLEVITDDLPAKTPGSDFAVVDRYQGVIPGGAYIAPAYYRYTSPYSPFIYGSYGAYLKAYPDSHYYGFSETGFRRVPAYYW